MHSNKKFVECVSRIDNFMVSKIHCRVFWYLGKLDNERGILGSSLFALKWCYK